MIHYLRKKSSGTILLAKENTEAYVSDLPEGFIITLDK